MPFDEQKHINQLVDMYERGFTNILQLLRNSPDEAYYRDILVDIREILQTLDANADKRIEQLISQTYSYNAAQTMAFLKSLGKQQNPGFAQVHQRAVDVLVQNLSDNLRNATQYVGRRVNDIFRAEALKAAGEKYAMGATIGDMRESLINRLVDQGYTAFVDKLGRKWRLDTYAEMVARTVTREAASVAVLNECEEFDVDLVMFSAHTPTCESCAPLQGKVYSISGKDTRYPKLTDDIRPPVHPNCRHSIQPYIRELDENAEETERQSRQKTEPKKVAPVKIAGVERDNPMTLQEAAANGGANPNYALGGGYHENCQTCVVAFEARRRGYNVVAKPYTKGSVLEDLARHSNLAWIDPTTGKHPDYLYDDNARTPVKFLEFLEKNIEPGKRYTLEHMWKGRVSYGHIVTIQRDETSNALFIFDPQSGETHAGNALNRYLNRIKYEQTLVGRKMPARPKLMRIDDKDFDLDVVNKILEAGQ
jgi:hypothetical protein